MRSALTTLGIVIGVGAVIGVVAIGEGASATVERAITNIGANLVWIEAGGVNRNGVRTGAMSTKSLTVADFDAIKTHVPQLVNLTPQAESRVQIVYGNQNWNTSVRGVGPEYVQLKNWAVVHGGMYTDIDVQRASKVCVLGQTVVNQLFGSEDPVGETIRVRDLPCVVVGVLEVKGTTATGQDQDDSLLMPYTTVMKRIKGQPWLDDIMGSATSAAAVDRVEQDISALLRERHHIAPGGSDDFNLRHPTEIADMVRQSTRTMEVLLAAVASVSLIVGGVGILLGVAGAAVIADVFGWPTRVSPNAVAVAFGCATAVGVFFGYYPARRAATLDPIEALRFE